MLLVVAIFLLPRRAQPLGELIPAPETARVDGLFCISTIVPTPDGYGNVRHRRLPGRGLSGQRGRRGSAQRHVRISVQRYYRLPTSLLSRFTQNENYVTVCGSPKTDRSTTCTSTGTRASSTTTPTAPSPTRSTATRQQAFSQPLRHHQRVRRVHPIKFSNKKLRMRNLIRSFFASLQHFLRHLPRVVVGVQQVVRLFAKRRAEVVLVERLDIRILVRSAEAHPDRAARARCRDPRQARYRRGWAGRRRPRSRRDRP